MAHDWNPADIRRAVERGLMPAVVTRGPRGVPAVPRKGVPQSEAEFQRAVLALAKLHGWLCAHFRRVAVRRANGQVYHETPVAADGVGWPDLVLVKAGRPPVYRELKTDGGRLRPAQRLWLDALRAAGADADTWRPRQWEEIRRTLEG